MAGRDDGIQAQPGGEVQPAACQLVGVDAGVEKQRGEIGGVEADAGAELVDGGAVAVEAQRVGSSVANDLVGDFLEGFGAHHSGDSVLKFKDMQLPVGLSVGEEPFAQVAFLFGVDAVEFDVADMDGLLP